MATRIQIRRGVAADWATTDPVLADGEIAIETDTGIVKVGDGTAVWSDLEPLFFGLYETKSEHNTSMTAEVTRADGAYATPGSVSTAISSAITSEVTRADGAYATPSSVSTAISAAISAEVARANTAYAPIGSTGGSGTSPIRSWEEWGAVGDARFLTCTTTVGSKLVTINAGGTVTDPADVGKIVSIPGCMGSTNGHWGVIESIVSPTSFNMTVAATSAVTSKDVVIATDDTTAMNNALTQLSQDGGGLLFGRSGSWYLHQYHLAATDNVYVINTDFTCRYPGAPINIRKTGYAPGNVHGAAANLATPNTSYIHWDVNNIAEGDTIITGSGGSSSRGVAGGITASAIVPGMVIGVRSPTADSIVSSGVEVPDRLYFTRVKDKNGEVLTVEDPAPWPITGAKVFYVNPNDTAVTSGPLAAPTWIVQNAGIINCTVDAFHPMWGGAAYEFTCENIRPRTGTRWNEVFSLNAMTHARFAQVRRANFKYTCLEPKFGSRDVEFEDISGYFWLDSGSYYTPLSIGESCTDIRLKNVNLTIGSDFSNSGLSIIDIRNCSGVTFRDVQLTVLAGNCDAVVSLPDTYKTTRQILDIDLEGLDIVTSAGVSQVFKLGGPVTDANEPTLVFIDGLRIVNVKQRGTLKSAVNRYMVIEGAVNVSISDHSIAGQTDSSGPASVLVGSNVVGSIELPEYRIDSRGALSGGLRQTFQTVQGRIHHTDQGTQVYMGGNLPAGSMVFGIHVDVLTAFNYTGTGANILTVGHDATANAYASGIDLSGSAGARWVWGNATPTSGSAGPIFGRFLTGLGATSSRQVRLQLAAGTAPGSPAGEAVVTVFYIPIGVTE